MTKLFKISLSILFLLCLLDWDYGFYQFVRFIGMIGFTYLSYQQYKKNDTWFYIWLVSAILINPIFKIALGRTIWNIADIAWAMLLIYSLFIDNKKKVKKDIDKPNEIDSIKRTPIYKDEDEEYLKYHYHRLFYEDVKELVVHYNKEVEIGMTGERLQILHFIMLDRLFLKKINESPIVINDDYTIKTRGKVYLSNSKLFYNKLKKVE